MASLRNEAEFFFNALLVLIVSIIISSCLGALVGHQATNWWLNHKPIDVECGVESHE